MISKSCLKNPCYLQSFLGQNDKSGKTKFGKTRKTKTLDHLTWFILKTFLFYVFIYKKILFEHMSSNRLDTKPKYFHRCWYSPTKINQQIKQLRLTKKPA